MLLSSPQEVFGRVRQRFEITAEQLLPISHGGRLPNGLSALEIIHAAAASSDVGFFAGASSENTVAELRRFSPDDEVSVISRAKRIAHGYVPIFGYGWVDVGSPPRWHTEPISGKVSPSDVHWSRVPYLDSSLTGDHKILWEFNRHQHFVTLAQAARYTGDTAWALEIRRQLKDWIDNNPAGLGVNWASSLEVAYRAISWCWTLRLLPESALNAVFDDGLADSFLDSVSRHGTHLSKYLSTWFSPNTHLTGEALGLVYLGTLFPSLEKASSWLRLGSSILEDEIGKQVRPDGVYFEQATQYHRYTTEIFLHYLLLARANRRSVSAHVDHGIRRLFDVLLALSRADGTMAILGDDDGGKLLQLDANTPEHLTSLLAVGAVALERGDLARVGRGDDAALIWLMGPGASAKRDLLARDCRVEVPTASAFRDGGIFTIRDRWVAPSGHMVVSCGPHGALSSGHAHADALSVELFSSAGPLFVDPGTFCYDGIDRNRFRGTAAHNTLEFAGQGASQPGSPFRWQVTTDAVLDHWWHEHGVTWFQGHHDGYGRIRDLVRHTRTVWHPAPGCWVICDEISQAYGLPVRMSWHAAPGLQVSTARTWKQAAELFVQAGAQERLATLVIGADTAGVVEAVDDQVSKQYGDKARATTVLWSGSSSGSLTVRSIVFDWTIFPADATRLLGFDGLNEIVIDSGSSLPTPPHGIPILDFRGPQHLLMLDGLTVSATASCYLPARDGAPARCVSLGGGEVSTADDSASSDPDGSRDERWMIAEKSGVVWTIHTGTVAASES